jgi:hypothetical protein
MKTAFGMIFAPRGMKRPILSASSSSHIHYFITLFIRHQKRQNLENQKRREKEKNMLPVS